MQVTRARVQIPQQGTLGNEGVSGAQAENHRLSGQLYKDYRVVLIVAGRANGLDFTPQVLAESAALFEGVPMYCDHGAGEGNRSVRDLVGMVTQARYNPARQQIEAVARLFAHTEWLEGMIAAAPALVPYFGLSADLWLYQNESVVTRIERVNSVDIVVNPAAGGRFVGPGPQAPEQGGPPSAGSVEGVSPQGQPEAGASVAAQGEESLMSQSAVPTQAQDLAPNPVIRVRNQETSSAPPAAGATGSHAAATGAGPEHSAPGENLCNLYLELKLSQANLPEALKDAVRATYQTMPMTTEQLDRLVASHVAAWAKAQEAGAIRGLGGTRVLDPQDHITLALERLLGAPETDAQRNAARLSGIREFYDCMTGDWERLGTLHPERVSFANVTTGTVTSIVANALNKVLSAQYALRPGWWKPIVAEYDLPNLNTVRWITTGGFSDLNTVSEGSAYTEKEWSDNEETSDFAKYGNYVGLTLEMIAPN